MPEDAQASNTPSGSAEATAKSPASGHSVDTARAWWPEQHDEKSAVPLSPGSVEQLGVWAKLHSRDPHAATPAQSASASETGEQTQATRKTRKSHDGYGAHPVRFRDPHSDPTHDSTGAPIHAVPAKADTHTANAERSASQTSETATASAPVDRHHARDSTMDAVTSCWRRDEIPSSAASVTSTSASVGAPVVATPRAECFDKASNHHPEGHWLHAKQEGDFSAHLSAHFMVRDSNAAVHVETDGSLSASKSSILGPPSDSGSPSLHPVVASERSLAGLSDHGRGCHSPKYFGSGHHKDSHGLNGHERGHRPLPWDTHSSAVPAGLKPYQKSHQKSTVHGERGAPNDYSCINTLAARHVSRWKATIICCLDGSLTACVCGCGRPGHHVVDHGSQYSPKPRVSLALL